MFALIYIQLILGATVRHTGYLVPFHILWAFLILFHALIFVLKISNHSQGSTVLPKLAIAFGSMIIVQLFLGMGAFVFTQMLESGYSPSLGEAFFTVFHQTLGALILGLNVLIALVLHH